MLSWRWKTCINLEFHGISKTVKSSYTSSTKPSPSKTHVSKNNMSILRDFSFRQTHLKENSPLKSNVNGATLQHPGKRNHSQNSASPFLQKYTLEIETEVVLIIVELYIIRMSRIPHHNRFHPRLRLPLLHRSKHPPLSRTNTHQTRPPPPRNIPSPRSPRSSQPSHPTHRPRRR